MGFRERSRKWLEKESLTLGILAVLLGTLYRAVMSMVMFLQADEEIFSYDAYYFILGRSFEFITRKIGAYIGYPALLSIWFRVFGISMLSARIFSVVCSAIMLIFVYLILRKLTDRPRVAMMGTLLMALLPFPLRYGHIVLTEPLVWAVISAGIFFLVKAMKEERWYLFLASGTLCGAAFFIRRSALILLLVIFVTLLWTNRDKFSKMMKESLIWAGGFLLPFAGGIFFFVAYFGYDKLDELRWTRIPNITPDWAVDLSGVSTYENALYALQPAMWKGTILVMLTLLGGVVILMSLFRDRWKAAYLAAFLWPAFFRLTFQSEISSLNMARIMIIPVVVLFIDRTYKEDHGFYLTLSILVGSTVAFSGVFLSGDIWNVIIYLSAGGMVMLYLADRLESRGLSLILLAGGLISLYLITFKEPQIATLVSYFLPVTAMIYGMSLMVAREPPKALPLAALSLFLPMVFLSDDPGALQYIAAFIGIGLGILPGVLDKRRWLMIRMFLPLIALAAALFIPERMPIWGVYLPLAGMALFMLSIHIRFGFMKRLGSYIPITGALLAFILAFLSTGSFLISSLALVITGTTSTVLSQVHRISMIWKERVGEKISILLLMLVMGYLAFYVYYNWTEIYLSEFIFQASIIGGLILWMLMEKHVSVRFGGNLKRIIRPMSVKRSATVLFIFFLVLSIPVSVGSYLEDDWFREESMDKRPYMRTMVEIGRWIEDHTDEDEVILAWHCYAIQADRETLLEVSNARVYSGKEAMEQMEVEGVDIFVRDWYVDHGLWRNQPDFQSYIHENFVIDRVIDGNECWIRVA